MDSLTSPHSYNSLYILFTLILTYLALPKIQGLEQAITKQVEQIHSLETQLQAAMKQAQDLAMRAFENASGKFAAKSE